MTRTELRTTGEITRINWEEFLFYFFYKRCLCFLKWFTVATNPRILTYDSGYGLDIYQRTEAESHKEGVVKATAGKCGWKFQSPGHHASWEQRQNPQTQRKAVGLRADCPRSSKSCCHSPVSRWLVSYFWCSVCVFCKINEFSKTTIGGCSPASENSHIGVLRS